MVSPLTTTQTWNVHLGSALHPARLGSAEFQRLLRDIQPLTRYDHGAAEAHSILGRAHRGQGDATLAEEHLRHAMRLDPADWIAPYNLAILRLERGEASATKEGVYLLRELRAQSEVARLPVRLFAAEALLAHGQVVEAVRVLREVARLGGGAGESARPGGAAGEARRLVGLVARENTARAAWSGLRRLLSGVRGKVTPSSRWRGQR